MATIRQFIQTNPARALELFSRLLDTSDKAIKTRERLFGELKDELELAVNLEEQHLFPVLKKHKETKDLVQEALARTHRAWSARPPTVTRDEVHGGCEPRSPTSRAGGCRITRRGGSA